MSRNASYQWICLRKLEAKPLKQRIQIRAASTETTPTEKKPPEDLPSEVRSALRTTLHKILHSEDANHLRRTQTLLSTIKDQAQTTHSVFETYPKQLRTVSLLPGIPPYRARPYDDISHRAPTVTSTLLSNIDRVSSNLRDLSAIPYPPSETENLIKEFKEWDDSYKKDELKGLEWTEESSANRMKARINELRNFVGQYTENPSEGSTDQPAFIKPTPPSTATLAPTPGFGGEETEVKTLQPGDVARTSNPFEKNKDGGLIRYEASGRPSDKAESKVRFTMGRESVPTQSTTTSSSESATKKDAQSSSAKPKSKSSTLMSRLQKRVFGDTTTEPQKDSQTKKADEEKRPEDTQKPAEANSGLKGLLDLQKRLTAEMTKKD